jgi:hypothetical protein
MVIPVPTAHEPPHMPLTKKRRKRKKSRFDFRCHQDNFGNVLHCRREKVCRQMFVRQLLELHHMHHSLQVVGPVLGSPVKRGTNVVGVFTGVVTLINVSTLL